MQVRSLHALCGLTAVSLLAACAANGGHAGPTPTAPLPTTPAGKAITATAPPPASHGSRTVKWIDLQVGNCLADLPPADLSRVTVTAVDCATAHLAEVYLRAPMAVDTAVADVANRDCAAGFAPYTDLIDSNQDRTGANPTPSTVICLLQAANGQPLTRSAHR
jgi:hypothetical protein